MLKKILLIVWFISPISSFSEEAETWLAKILRITGISATSSGQKGDDDMIEGEIWMVSSSGKNLRRVAIGNNYKSPIFYGKEGMVFALQDANLVKFDKLYGLEKPKVLFPLPNILKLIDSRNLNNELLVLDVNSSLGVLSLTDGNITLLPYSATTENKAMINYLTSWTRDYNGTSLFINSNSTEGMHGEIEWMDIYLKEGQKSPTNLSLCKPLNCTQPSMSNDNKHVLFIKEMEE